MREYNKRDNHALIKIYETSFSSSVDDRYFINLTVIKRLIHAWFNKALLAKIVLPA